MNLLKFITVFLLLGSCLSLKQTNNIQLILEIESEGKDITQQEKETMQAILAKRLDSYGISKRKQSVEINNNQLSINLQDIENPENIKELLTAPGKLEFWETFTNDEIDIYKALIEANKIIKQIIEEQDSKSQVINDPKKRESDEVYKSLIVKIEAFEEEYLIHEDSIEKEYPLFTVLQPNLYGNGLPKQGSVIGYSVDTNINKVNEYLAIPDVQALFPQNLKFLWSAHPTNSESDMYELHAIKVSNYDGNAILENNCIENVKNDIDKYTREAFVKVTMNEEHSIIWRNMTRSNIGKFIIIAVDDKVYISAMVREEISGGSVQISGNFTHEEAKNLTNILNSLVLPYNVKVISEKITH